MLAGLKPAGTVKATVLLPAVLMAPLRWTTPAMTRAAGPAVRLTQFPYTTLFRSGVYEVADLANEAPSSEVKHWASDHGPSESTLTLPPGAMISRPLAAL